MSQRCSRGIGLQVAKAALKRGAEVFIAGRSPEKLEAAETSLGKSARVRTIAADMTKEANAATSGFNKDKPPVPEGSVVAAIAQSSALLFARWRWSLGRHGTSLVFTRTAVL